jgi:hypothetical protein
MREKLIELLKDTHANAAWHHWGYEESADHLIANGVTVQRWIPASEPPKKNGRYLCRYVFNEQYDMPFEQVLSYFATDLKPHFQYEGCDLGVKVTHWMPLPEPPKEGRI